jgi:hypothetical protein
MALLRLVGRSNGRALGNGWFAGDQEVDLPLPGHHFNFLKILSLAFWLALRDFHGVV